MAIRSGFFNSVNGDRKYDAKRFAEYFASFIGNGVFPNPSSNLQVTANDDMTVTVRAGKAWINGYILINDDDYILELEPADGVLNRIDRVVARYDVVGREIRAYVKQGEFASNAIAQELQRDADAYEIALADIKVNAGATTITQADITDTRLNKELCGIVHGTVDQVDTTAIFKQFESWYEQTKSAYDADMATWTTEKKQAFDDWYETNTAAFMEQFSTWYEANTAEWTNDFNEWFETIKGQLDGDIAANLAGQIVELQNEKANKTELDAVNQDLDAHKADYMSYKSYTQTEINALKNNLSNIKSNDIQARREILDIKLKLDEMEVVDYLNKTGIGFYDLFENTEYIDITNTTATVDTASADVVFTGQEMLKMLLQKFDASINNIELAIYDIDRESYQVDNSVSNSTQIRAAIQPGRISIGDKYFYNGEVYEVTGVSEA